MPKMAERGSLVFLFQRERGRRLAFVGWELGFPGGAAAVCERVRFLARENGRLWEMTVGRLCAEKKGKWS